MVALKNVCAVKCFMITFALEMCVRGARENALVSGARCMDSDHFSFRYWFELDSDQFGPILHSYHRVLYPEVAEFEAIDTHLV